MERKEVIADCKVHGGVLKNNLQTILVEPFKCYITVHILILNSKVTFSLSSQHKHLKSHANYSIVP